MGILSRVADALLFRRSMDWEPDPLTRLPGATLAMRRWNGSDWEIRPATADEEREYSSDEAW